MISFFHQRNQRGFRRFERGFTLLELVVVLAIMIVLSTILIVKTADTRVMANETGMATTMNTVREAIMGSPAAPGYLADMKYMPGFDKVTMQIRTLPWIDPTKTLQMRDLLDDTLFQTVLYDPITRKGWRGRYLGNVQPVMNLNPARAGRFPAKDDQRFKGDLTFLQRGFYDSAGTSPYGVAGDAAAADLWGNPIVVQVPPLSSDEDRIRYTRIVSAGLDGRLDTPLDRLAGMHSDGTTEARGDDVVIFLNRSDVYEP